MYRVRCARPAEVPTLQALDRATLPEAPPSEDTAWWGAWDAGGALVGYAGARFAWYGSRAVFLSRAGVVEAARGHGLQARLVRARVAWARRKGAPACYTYTTPDNAPSMRTLIRCGFRPYEPDRAWAGPGFVYWRRVL